VETDVSAPEWLVLVYRVPSEPASKRVAVWRDLKKLGALYLQQCVCILPRLGGVPDALAQIARKIEGLGGESLLLEAPRLSGEDERKVIAEFRELRDKEYAEIVEECETKFVKEIEFERFRANFTFEEAEEIQQDLEKIRRWYDTVKARDWFDAAGSAAVATWLERCAELYAGFEEEVYRHVGGEAAVEPGELNSGARRSADCAARRAETSSRNGTRAGESDRATGDRVVANLPQSLGTVRHHSGRVSS
jgi:hypothetical protein